MFVSAGGRGMGQTTVLEMQPLGAYVFSYNINRSGLDIMRKEISSWHVNISVLIAVDHMFDKFIDDCLDIAANNAGIVGHTKPIEDVANDEWRRTMIVCIDSQFYTCRRAIPVFKAQKSGAINNMLSAAGIFGFPNRSP